MTDNQKAQIIKLRTAGNGYGTIAQTLGISLNTVKSFCRRNDINGNIEDKPSVALTGETTACENCGREIYQIAKQKRKRFCCDKCRNTWWNSHLDQVKRKAVYDFKCPYCGKEFHIYGDKRRKYCSHACYIADRFKGGDGRE
jgi:endogenous inhibitor of DNA gyrase (YacG/DUF329 family)